MQTQNIIKTGIVIAVAFLAYRYFRKEKKKKVIYDRGFEFEIQEEEE